MAHAIQVQREKKRAMLEACWQKAKLPAAPKLSWQATPQRLGYRNRVRCQVTASGDVRFFNRHKLDGCAVLEPSVLEGISVARALAAREWPLMRQLSHLEVRARDARATGAIVLYPRLSNVGTVANLEPCMSGFLVALGNGQSVPCQDWQLEPGLELSVPVNAFFQVNTQVNRLLVAHVKQGLRARGARTFADLFMGSGNFALPLLKAGLVGYGAESHAGAIRAAGRSAIKHELAFEELWAGDTFEGVEHWLARGLVLDAVVVDPPRAGLREAAARIAALARRWLIMCSCNPNTLVRDLGSVIADGFSVEEVRLFDMFPQTAGLEVVVWLSR